MDSSKQGYINVHNLNKNVFKIFFFSKKYTYTFYNYVSIKYTVTIK